MQIAYGTSGIPWVRSLEGVEVLESGIGELKATKSEDELVLEAMAKPIDSPKLSETVNPRRSSRRRPSRSPWSRPTPTSGSTRSWCA